MVGSVPGRDNSAGPDGLLRSLAPRPLWRAIRMAGRTAQLCGMYFSAGARFTCPICGFIGPFLTAHHRYGDRPYATCPWCGALERHRLQFCVLEEFFRAYDPRGKAAIHFAPERPIARYLRAKFADYTTADLSPSGVDHQADLRHLPFADKSFDFLYASHVLEHIDDDRRALAEIKRVLKPAGIAILPVPILCAATVEYPHPVAAEEYHVRAPGLDYYERYREAFATVSLRSSADFDTRFQLYIHEDRSSFPPALFPYRPITQGERHLDYVPICCAS